MPFRSKAQQRFLEANKKKIKGLNIKEWEKSTNYKTLPARKKKKSAKR